MAFTSGKNTKFYFGANDLSAFLTSADSEQMIAALDTTTFGAANSSKTFIPGLVDGKVSANGLFAGAATDIDATLQPILAAGTIAPLTISVMGAASIGDRCKVIQAEAVDYKVQSPVAGVVSLSASFQPSGGIWGGVVLEPVSAKTNTGNSASSVDNGAASSNGLVANIHCPSFTSGTLNAKVQHSTNNSVWVDLITFTALTAAGSEQKTVAGSVSEYLRASWATTFSATFGVFAARY